MNFDINELIKKSIRRIKKNTQTEEKNKRKNIIFFKERIAITLKSKIKLLEG